MLGIFDIIAGATSLAGPDDATPWKRRRPVLHAAWRQEQLTLVGNRSCNDSPVGERRFVRTAWPLTIRASCRGTRPLVSPSLTEPRDDSRCKGLWPNSPVRIGGFASDNVTRPALTLAGMSFAIALSCGRRPSRPPVAQCASHPPKRAERPVRSREPGASLGVLGEYGLPRRGDAVAWHAPRLPLVKLGLHGAHPPALRW